MLQDNGGDDLSVTANGSFTFATAVASGAGYSVTVKTNPSGQSCTVSNGSGTVGSANVTSVAVSCTSVASSASDDFTGLMGVWGRTGRPTLMGGWRFPPRTLSGRPGRLPVISGRRRPMPVISTRGAGDLDAAERGSVGRAGGLPAGRRAVRLPGHLLLEFRQPGAEALQEDRGNWTQLGSGYNGGALAAGTQLQLVAVGSTISFLENGV